MSKKYKIVIFGATGFTGELCAKFMSERYSDIPIAIAGRNKKKLEKIKKAHNLPFPIIVADAFDVSALEKMCKDAEVVLSTAGPFHKYGSDLLEACVKNGCHYVDITGESFWVKDMIEKHHEAAEDKGLRIINACGFDEMFRSPVSNPLIMPVHAATCPPAEPPAATILFGSTPNFFEFFLIIQWS